MPSPRLSKRVSRLEESATLAMSRKASALKAQGAPIISLSLGEPDFPTPDHICQAAIQAIEEKKWFSYSPVAGYQDVRQAIAEKLIRENNIQAQASNIVISTGAKQSISNIFAALLNPQDEVLLAAPYWVSYYDIANLYEAKPIIVPTYIADGYRLRAEVLEQAITPNSKLLVFSSPSNPTGAVLGKEALNEIAAVLEKHPHLFVLSDEIYEHINFTPQHYSLGAWESLADRVITVNGLSKSYAMTGWRLGYMHAQSAIARACEKLQGQCTSGTNSVAQRTIIAALSGSQAPSKAMCETYRKRKEYVLGRLKQIPNLGVYEPQGAYYMFPDISGYLGKSFANKRIQDANDLAMYLLEEVHVATVSGLAFGEPKAIRISFAASDSNIAEALDRIESALQKLH